MVRKVSKNKGIAIIRVIPLLKVLNGGFIRVKGLQSRKGIEKIQLMLP